MQDSAPLAGRPGQIEQGLAAAHELFRRGELDQAEAMCRQLLSQVDDNGDLFTLLGMVVVQKGDPEASIHYFEKALTLRSDEARSHNNLGLAFKRAGRLEEAESAYGAALSIDGQYAQAHNNLGVVLRDKGEVAGAIASFRAALNVDPAFVDARRNLASALLESNQLGESAAEFHRILESSPNDAGAHLSLASVSRQLANFDEASAYLERILDGEPNHPEALSERGLVLQEQGDLYGAKAAYEQVVSAAPDHAQAHDSLGVVLQALGDLDAAVASFRRAISARPDYAEAHRHLAFARRHVEVDDDIRLTESLLESDADDASVMHASFALAKICDDLGQYDDAFMYLSRANRLKRQTIRYDVGQDRVFFENLKRTFDKTFFADHENWGVDDPAPIFILGMPRSGTTLVEQILASHSRVRGAGETLDLDRLLWEAHETDLEKDWCDAMSANSKYEVMDLAASYLSSLKRSGPAAERITDKTPGNFHYVGMIRVMLPRAKVINCVRDPLDTCFSCYQNYFTQGVSFAYELSELGTYYRLYANLMDHWQESLPGFVHDLRYEELLQNQEAETRKLLEFCDMEWDDACLDFHLTERPVHTASVNQVRRPIYKSSLGRAARYSKHLAPLRDALGDRA